MKDMRRIVGVIMVAGLVLAAGLPSVLADNAGRALPLEQEHRVARVQPLEQHVRAAVAAGGFTDYVVKPGDTLSGLAARFLNSARNWPLLLKYNRIANPHLIYPGQHIVIPVADRAKAEAAIRAAQAVRAARGAQPEADDLLNSALAAFRDNEFGIAFGLAERARLLYETAAEPAVVEHNVSAPLTVVALTGECFHQVGAATPVLLRQGMQIAEGGEVITGPESKARLTFADGSAVLLEAATRLRVDMARVSMAGEGRYALELFIGSTEWQTNAANGRWTVTGMGGRIQLLGSAAAIDIHNGRMAASAWQGPLKVGEVNVAAGYGLVIRPGEEAGAPVPLPAAPQLTVLVDNDIGYRSPAEAAELRLEIARDREFRDLVQMRKFPDGESFDLRQLAEGNYFLRMGTTANNGLRGLPGVALAWREDRTPPILTVSRPTENILAAGQLDVAGRTEPNAKVVVNGVMAQMAADGGFTATIDLTPGVTVVLVEAVDPSGNRAQWQRALAVRGDPQVFTVRENKFYTRLAQLPVTLPVAGGRITLGGQTIAATASSLVVTLNEGENRLRVQVPTVLGMRESQVVVYRDLSGPQLAGSIRITTYPPTIAGGSAQMKVVVPAKDDGIGLAGQAFADFHSTTDRRYHMMLPYDSSEGGYCAIMEISPIDIDAEINCDFVHFRDRLNNVFEMGKAGGGYGAY